MTARHAHPATTVHHAKKSARHEFERWAHSYDRSILQHLLFRPTFEIMLEEVTRWRSADAELARATFDVLDIGCGTGTWAALLYGSRLPVRVVGLDYSGEMCRKSLRKARHAGAHDLRFINGDSEHLPFRSGSFDLVTCSHSFHHYPHQGVVVREMRRVLRPGGRVMVADGFRDNIVGWFVFDVCVTRVEGNVYHVPWAEMRRLFEEAGFADIVQRKFNVWAPALLTMGAAPRAE
ncbi:MAG: methyltransferase domain-containing protein [Phycisphaerae bacterium]|nr:methyltransferase domain-containing protein [Phycisphaerae bacterium]NUQ44912.1 methyltransferase domain-containing protein [Phycisphaerae bacterium]